MKSAREIFNNAVKDMSKEAIANRLYDVLDDDYDSSYEHGEQEEYPFNEYMQAMTKNWS